MRLQSSLKKKGLRDRVLLLSFYAQVAGTPPLHHRGIKNPCEDIYQCSKLHKVSTTSQFGTPFWALHCSVFPRRGFFTHVVQNDDAGHLCYIMPFILLPINFALYLQLLPDRNPDPGSHSGHPPPPCAPATIRAFTFIARGVHYFLPSLTHVGLCVHTLGVFC